MRAWVRIWPQCPKKTTDVVMMRCIKKHSGSTATAQPASGTSHLNGMTKTLLVTAASRLFCAERRSLLVGVTQNRSGSYFLERQARLKTTNIEERRANREAELAAKRERRKAAKQREAELNAYHEAFDENSIEKPDVMRIEAEAKEKERIRDEERTALLLEAGAMSRSLFRTCLRCVKIMRQGNEHDEEDFREREENQLVSMKDAIASGTFSMGPPVDRENELSSRAIYYHRHTREHFDGESHCLKHNPWIEQHVDRYLHFLRTGEEKRKWVMNDYKFTDPFETGFDNERVDRWEVRARSLLKETYDANDWILPSELRSREWPKTKWGDDDED